MKKVDVTLAVVTNAFMVAWSKDTSSDKDWSFDNPALGQCTVAVCVIQDYFGGEIKHVTVILPNDAKISHYYNDLNGIDIDVTKQQFPEGSIFINPGQRKGDFKTTREYCLSFPDTLKRYELLKSRIEYLVNDSQFLDNNGIIYN